MTFQGPLKLQPKVEQHHLVHFIPKVPAPEGRRLSPTHISAVRRVRWMLTAHQPSNISTRAGLPCFGEAGESLQRGELI